MVLLVILVAAVFLSGLGRSLYPPDAATTQAQDTRQLYNIVFAIAVAIFVAVEGLIVWSILRYRRKPGDDELPPQTHGNNLVEVIWTVIPTAIVLFLFAISYQTLNTVDAVSANPDVRIHVVAAQFTWKFEYLDGNGNVIAAQTVSQYGTSSADCKTPSLTNPACGGMAVPVGQTIHVTEDSADVIHSWYVPQFLFKRDVIPGQTNQFEFKVDPADVDQVFRGQCAELCGVGHRTMLFSVQALKPDEYNAWLASLVELAHRTPPPAPSGATTLQLIAKDIHFDKDSLEVAANQPFVIDFKNQDPAGVSHDVDIRQTDGTTVVVDQQTTDGGQESQYQYQGLPAGTYTFICSIHPSIMHGTLTVK
ncbi:MAG TPA: cytochrome c oxidase subunit II [Candidatus Limnocylindrales bacterium]|nr:cytochrome c oxidase subunit II [Candidatus Limnocylindrales bacterium]